MQLQLNGWNVQPKELVLGVKGSYGCDSLTIAFSPEWEGLEKIVVFDAGSETGAVHIAMMDRNTVEIPRQVMEKSGICPIVIYGMAQGKARYSVAVMGMVLDCPKIDGEQALPVEPDLWEQYFNEISQQRQQAQQAAEQAYASEQKALSAQQICEDKSAIAQDAAQSAQISAQNAAELVKKYPIVKDGTWWIWNFDAKEYLDTQVPAKGPQGEKGDTGAVGPQGPQGEKGDTGAVGPQGPQGEKGDTGAVGSQGPQGEKGDTGAVGPQGPQGEKGDTGAVGPQGPQGEKGDTGAVGPQGPQGEKGDTGEIGPQGPQGEKGDTGAVGPQGPQGEKGDTGAVGPQGPQGEKGDTGAVGPQGPGGEKGDTGAEGPQGPQGEKGDTGAVGPQGPQGEKGDTGAVGPQGPKGEKGDTGAVGPQGPQGEKGDTGAQGVAGPAGPNAVSSSTTVSGFTSGHYLYNNNGRVAAKAITPASIGALPTTGTAANSSKLENKTLAQVVAMATPAGVVMATAAKTAPSGWLICDGRAVSRSTYAALFTAIGTLYGSGDGSTTFNLPNLNGATIIGGSSTEVGRKIGEAEHTLSVDELPAHTHRYGFTRGTESTEDSGQLNHVKFGAWYSDSFYSDTYQAGNGQAHNNIQPSVYMTYIIKT